MKGRFELPLLGGLAAILLAVAGPAQASALGRAPLDHPTEICGHLLYIPKDVSNDIRKLLAWVENVESLYRRVGENCRETVFDRETLRAKAVTQPVPGAPVPFDSSAASVCKTSKAAVFAPSGRFAYATGGSGPIAGICAYGIDADRRALFDVPGTPFATSQFVKGVAIDPTGSFLYAISTDADTIEAFTIDQETGVLTKVSGSPYPAGPSSSRYIVVDPTGRFVYTSNTLESGAIRGYAIDQESGGLTELPGSPFAVVARPFPIAADVTGGYLYVGGDRFQVYAIDSGTGALALASTVSSAVADIPARIAVDPSGRFVYTTVYQAIKIYAVGAAGTLTHVGAPVPISNFAFDIGVSRSGRYVYVVDSDIDTITGFRINLIDGTLTPIEGSPFPSDESPSGIATGGYMFQRDTASVGIPFSNNLGVSGGRAPYTFSVLAGTLPPGLSLAATTGMLTGTPVSTGSYDFTTQVMDALGDAATAKYTIVVVPTGKLLGQGNYQGLWWNAPAGSEAGWGINFAHQGDIIFATWFTYDASGKPLWLAAVLNKSAEGVYSGDVFTTTGPNLFAVPWDGSTVVETTVGSATVSFTGDDTAAFNYTVNGITQQKSITRQVFDASGAPACTWGGAPDLALATNYQDLWWNAPQNSEPGWGVNFTHQGDIIFFTWFTYGADNQPRWLIAVATKKAGTTNVYEGPISTVTGPPFNAVPWDPNTVVETIVGSTTITFADGNHASFAYTVDGVTQTKEITRQVFAPPGTVCQ